jgi:hypothetical protein
MGARSARSLLVGCWPGVGACMGLSKFVIGVGGRFECWRRGSIWFSMDGWGHCGRTDGGIDSWCDVVGVGGSVFASFERGSAGAGAGVLTALVARPAALLSTARPRSAIVPADHHALRRRSRRRTHCFSSSVARLTWTFSRRERKWRYTTLSATPSA